MLRKTLPALAVLVLVLGVTACGGVGETLNPLALSAQKSANAGGVTMHLDASFSAGGQSGSLSADGRFDGDQGELTLHLGDLLAGTGLSAGDVKAIVAKQDGHPELYVQAPNLASLLPGGKPWLKLDVDQLAKQLGNGQAQGLFGATGASPADALNLLRKVATVTEVGSEAVDGVDTTHYRADVDLVQALQDGGAPADAIAELKASGVDTKLPVDVWVGKDDGLVRKLHVSYATDANGQHVSGEVTMTLSDYGADVSVDVPSDDQVLDATKLLGALAGKP